MEGRIGIPFTLKIDGATITPETELFRYMAKEVLAGVHFLEATDSGCTATLLAAISKVLASCGDSSRTVHLWKAKTLRFVSNFEGFFAKCGIPRRPAIQQKKKGGWTSPSH